MACLWYPARSVDVKPINIDPVKERREDDVIQVDDCVVFKSGLLFNREPVKCWLDLKQPHVS